MRKTKKWIALLVAMAMTLTAFAGCGNGKSGGDKKDGNQDVKTGDEASDDEHVTLRIFMVDAATPDDEAVEEYINSLPQVKKLNVSIDIVKQAGGWSEYFEKLPLLLSTNEQMDIGFDNSANFAGRIVQGAYKDLSEYLEKDKDFYEAIPEALWTGMKYKGGIYGVPTYKEIAEQWTFYADSAMLKKYDIDPATITDFQDLEVVLEACKKDNRTGLTILTRNYNQVLKLGLLDDYDFVNGLLYAVIKHDEGKTVVNPFETEEFAELIRTMYDWNKKGYVDPDTLTITENEEWLEGGLLYGVPAKSHSPLADRNTTDGWESNEILYVAGQPKVTNDSARGSVFGVFNKCKNPERAYEFLKLWNTDPEVKNAFYLGVPDKHYKLVDGKAEQVEKRMELYAGQNWTTGNNLISTLLVTEPDDKWEQFEAWNKTAYEACDLGMCLNTDKIANKQATVNAVMAEYLPPLLFGFVEPESGIAELNKQLKAAGLEDVIEEIQKQYTDFLATK